MEHNQQEKGAREQVIDDCLPITSSRNAKWWYSAFHNVTAMVGAGVLSLPYAMAELGWYLSLIPILLSSDQVKKMMILLHLLYYKCFSHMVVIALKMGFLLCSHRFFFPLLFWAFKGFSVYGVSSHDVRIVNITDGSFMHSTIDLISSTDEFVFQ